MARQSAASGSRRRHSGERRRRRLTSWFTGKELDGIRAAAGVAGMAPAAWLAQTGTEEAAAVVSGSRLPAGQVADAVAAMDAAVMMARRQGNLLNQAVRTLHITGQRSPELSQHAAAVDRAVERMEAALLRTARKLLG